MTSHLAGQAAIVGVGTTAQGLFANKSADDQAVDAVRLALADAGIDKSQIDGLIVCKTLLGTNGDVLLGHRLGLNPSYSATLDYGTCNYSIHLAAMVLMAGLARTVLLAYGTNQGTVIPAGFRGVDPPSPYGFHDHIAGQTAMMFQRHRHRYGMTEEQLGAVSVAQRRWAQLNPAAVRREPLSLADYMAAPYHVSPIRAYDVSPFDDGGAALIITTADRARDFPNRPVHVTGMAQTAALRMSQNPDNLDREWNRKVADRVFETARLNRTDIDIVSIQDPGSMWTIQMLEQFGFVGPGEAGAFIAEGRTSPGGELPVNTSGGHLSESYMWGWLHSAEVVRQLRGICGERQVPDAQFAIHCATMGEIKGSATIYSRGE